MNWLNFSMTLFFLLMCVVWFFWLLNGWRDYQARKHKRLAVSMMDGVLPNSRLIVVVPLVPVDAALISDIVKIYSELTKTLDVQVGMRTGSVK